MSVEAAILAASSLRVRIDGRTIVDGVDLEVRGGRAIAVVGPSGSGKSTLARALVGLEVEVAGELTHRGAPIDGSRGAWARLRREVQLCWQDPSRALDPRRSVDASIDEARHLAGLPRWRADEPARLGLAEELGLAVPHLRARPSELSGGQQQRAAIARALAAEPKALIADEITSALDRPIARELAGLLARRVAAGLGLLVITHDLALWPPLCDEVVVLAEGRVIERGAPAKLLTEPTQPLTRALCGAVYRLS
ncbi:MAG: ATP-binding cassette domain-containing protein [Nannocystaceae bacterium]